MSSSVATADPSAPIGDQVIGPDVVLPGSEHLAPAFFAVVTLGLLIALAVVLLVRRRRAAREDRRPPVWLASLSVLALLAAFFTYRSWPPAFFTPEFPALARLFPDEAFFYRPIDDLAVDPGSDAMIAALGDEPLFASFGGQKTGGVVFGMPFNLVDATTPRTSVSYRATWSAYPGEFPIADPAYIESLPTYGFDNHYIAIDPAARSMWELIGTTVWFGRWQADSGARWDLDSLELSEYSTTAPGLPVMPGVITYAEVAAGAVDHVVWATSPLISPTEAVWPARASDGRSEDPDAPPMGAWLRLRADADLSGLGPQAQVIAEGLRTHGLMLSDYAPNFTLRGTADARFDLDDLRTLRSLSPADFEVVDHLGLMVDQNSMAARQPGD